MLTLGYSSFTRQTTQIIGTGGWYGGGWYNGWWGPGYWGPYWNDWYYPYPVTYSYNTGTLIMEMVNLTDHPEGYKSESKVTGNLAFIRNRTII